MVTVWGLENITELVVVVSGYVQIIFIAIIDDNNIFTTIIIDVTSTVIIKVVPQLSASFLQQ